MGSITVNAAAKLNLALSVGQREESSGLHPICSWMVTVDLHDELLLTRLPPDRLSRYAIMWHDDALRRSDIDWSITRDLAVRAHLALEQRIGRRLPVQMKLEKRIPVGSGLGGGSADAAAMLRGCNTLFELGLSDDELAAVGAAVGSDIPFLVRGGSAIVEGVGDEIVHHDESPELHAVLAFPEQACATAAVYAQLDAKSADRPLRAADVRALAAMAGRMDPDALFNDLTDAALEVAPELRGHRDRITALAERRAHVTGSGSGLFVVCDDPMHAEALAAAIEQQLELPAAMVRTTARQDSTVDVTEPSRT